VLNKRWPLRGLQRQWADEHEMIEMRYAFWVWVYESAGSRWAVAISLFFLMSIACDGFLFRIDRTIPFRSLEKTEPAST
jgi:hypothetical protein